MLEVARDPGLGATIRQPVEGEEQASNGAKTIRKPISLFRGQPLLFLARLGRAEAAMHGLPRQLKLCSRHRVGRVNGFSITVLADMQARQCSELVR